MDEEITKEITCKSFITVGWSLGSFQDMNEEMKQENIV